MLARVDITSDFSVDLAHKPRVLLRDALDSIAHLLDCRRSKLKRYDGAVAIRAVDGDDSSSIVRLCKTNFNRHFLTQRRAILACAHSGRCQPAHRAHYVAQFREIVAR